MKFNNACVITFTKEPVAGKVKTRLISELGAQGACELHERLLSRQIEVLNESQLCHFQLWVNNNPQHSAFSSFQGERYCQIGDDLGEKMLHAAQTTLQRFQYVVIIGSDCPQMDESYLEKALNALSAGNEVVLGPAEDGGYVLIALSQPYIQLFQAIDWGSSTVLKQTRQILQNNVISWQELETNFDIDRPEDLLRLKMLGIKY